MGKSAREVYDVVYILKKDVEPDELRYSLRSLVNFPHGKVWFFTGCPEGFRPDRFVPFEQVGRQKWHKATSTYRAICETDEVTDKFWMFNDDFFILEKTEELPYMYNGHLAELISFKRRHSGASTYTRRLGETRMELERRELDTLNYCIHAPMLFEKAKVLKVLDEFADFPMFRSIYGNYWKVGGIDTKDVKVSTPNGLPDGPLCSTSDQSFREGAVGEFIRNRFKDPCKWEEAR